MSNKFFILLEEFSSNPTAEIGEMSKSISKLVSAGIPVPKAVCIPSSTLRIIAQTNKLDSKIHKLIQETDFNSSLSKEQTVIKIKKLIFTQQIPVDLAREFLKIYHSDLHSNFVSLQNSTTIGNRKILLENIKGDVNVVDAFLEIWAKTAEHAFNKFSDRTKELDKILFPSPILIQQQIDVEISGIALTFDEQDGSKKRFTIKGVWGIFNHNLSEADTFIADSRTFNLIQKTLKKQVSQFIRDLENLKKLRLGENKKYSSVLKIDQVNELAKIISKISRLSIVQLEIGWGLQNNVFFIHAIKETEYVQRNDRQKPTLKKIYVSPKSVRDIEIIEKYADGICILNSGEFLSSLGEHPAQIVKTKKGQILIETAYKNIVKYRSVKQNSHLIYRAHNLTSNELSKLKNASNYESKELNPSLGLRGGSKILSQPEIFNLELKIIKKIIKENGGKISLLIPFVRFSSELSRIIMIIEKSGLTKFENFDVWMELSTPENVLNLDRYPLNKIAGVVFNTRNINSLILGVDLDDDEILSRHTNDNRLVIAFINNTAKSLRNYSLAKNLIKKPELLIDLLNYNSGIIKDVINQDVTGIIIEPRLTANAKKCIINEESKIIA